MKFMINGAVQYNSSDGTLLCLDSHMDMLTLTRLSSELLLFLINNNGISISRDAILFELWEKRGLSASSNNLNNYVSMLRKALAQCGYPDLITTIPKYGFLFDAEITVVIDERGSEKPESESISSSVADAVDPVKADKIIDHGLKSCLAKRKLTMALLLVGLMTLFLPNIYNVLRLHSLRTEIFSMDQCRFYLLGDESKRINRSFIIGKIKSTITRKNLSCNIKANVYYFYAERIEIDGRQLVNQTIAYCPYSNKVQCKNYYLYDHEIKNEK